MEIKIKFSEHDKIDDKLRNNDVHVIAFAELGKSVFRTYGEFIGNIPHVMLQNYCDQANMIYGYITLFPLMHLTVVARKYLRQEMKEIDKIRFERIIRDIFRLDTSFIKSKHIVFDFTCAVHNKDFIKKCISAIAFEIEQKNSRIEICEIWLDNYEPFVN